MKEENLNGKLRQNFKGGPYYCRLMVANGVRKEFALKTSDHNEACIKAADLDPIWDAPTKEAALEQIKAIRGFSKAAANLPLTEIWAKYEAHPDHARPSTTHESLMYSERVVGGRVHGLGGRSFETCRKIGIKKDKAARKSYAIRIEKRGQGDLKRG